MSSCSRRQLARRRAGRATRWMKLILLLIVIAAAVAAFLIVHGSL